MWNFIRSLKTDGRSKSEKPKLSIQLNNKAKKGERDKFNERENSKYKNQTKEGRYL